MMCRCKLSFLLIACSIALGFGSSNAALGASRSTVLFVFDSSGSMSGVVGDGLTKIDVAKDALNFIVDKLPAHYRLGLIYFQGNCQIVVHDLTKVKGKEERVQLKQTVNALQPSGDTPLAIAIVKAGDLIRQEKLRKGSVHVVILSDGGDTCGGQPCEEVKNLRKQGLKITFHTIGFRVNQSVQAELDCVANAGGGKSYSARDKEDIVKALTDIKNTIGGKGKSKKSNDKGGRFFRPAE